MDYKIVILGGGVAGLTAALYSGRASVKTLLIEESFIGGTTATLQSVENFPGIPNMKGIDFVTNLYSQVISTGVDVKIDNVVRIDFNNKLIIADSGEFSYKALIIATGSRYNKLLVPGEKELSQKGVSYCAVCDGPLFKNKKIVVVTNGFSAKSSIDFLENISDNITVLDLSNKYQSNKYKVYNNVLIKQIIGDSCVRGVTIIFNGIEENIMCDCVFVSIGKSYNNDIFDGAIDINNGQIVTNADYKTNTDCVFACGDIRYGSTKQIICACGEGAAATLNAIKLIKK